jgi:glycosyltransferase involved in cell wall biosynthesis
MSAGCAIVASDTAPVREAITHDATGHLVNFFDAPGLANAVCGLLEDEATRTRLGASARAFAQTHYDLTAVCLPQQLQWVQFLAA